MNGDSINMSSNRSDLKLLKNDEPDLMSRNSLNKEEPSKTNKKPDDEQQNEVVIHMSESIDEVSANDYGYFTLKALEEREELNGKVGKITDGFMGIINKAIQAEMSLTKNNYINMLNGEQIDFTAKKKFKIVKSDFELLMHLGRDENDYKNFKVINPNEEIYKRMVKLSVKLGK